LTATLAWHAALWKKNNCNVGLEVFQVPNWNSSFLILN